MQFKNWMWAVVLIIGLSACQQGGTSSVSVDLNNEDEKFAYSYGVYTAETIKSQGFPDVNQDIFIKGMKDKLSDKDLLVSQDSIMTILNAYAQKAAAEATKKIKEEGEAFLTENKNREGVTVTESGLQYEVLVEGDGPIPTLQDKVTTHYHGTLIDGTVFDSSVDKGKPVAFPVSGVIAGWTEALQLMKVGSKWKLYVPSDLAYGDRGAGQLIKPGSALIFEVELIGIGDLTQEN